MTPTIELLRSHRSIRHFTDAPISDEQRAAIIASAQGASQLQFFTMFLNYSRYRPGNTSTAGPAERRPAARGAGRGVLGILR